MMYGRSLAIGGCFLALVILLSALIFYLSLGPCPPGTFACDDGQMCVPQRQICNNHNDCKDGSDENPIECGILYGSKELTDKIVGRAIEKHQQRLQQHHQQQQEKQVRQERENETIEANQHTRTRTRTQQILNVQQEVELPPALNTAEKDIDNVNTTKMQVEATKQTSATGTITAATNTNGVGSIVRFDGVGDGIDTVINNSVPNATTICEISTYPSHCTCKRSILYCNERARLMQIPQMLNVSAEVTNLIINHNNLTLHSRAFARLSQLQRLTLKYDNISILPGDVFAGLVRLERLDIRHNNFSQLPAGIFQDLHALQWLFIISNQLRDFPLAHLRDIPQLEWLKLSDNFLTLRNERFPSMRGLYELYLDFNRIEFVGEHTFEQLNNLHLLDLNGNIITHIHQKAFFGLENIRDIRLTSNPIKALSDDTFSRNYYLEALSLGHTPLQLGVKLMKPLNVSFLNLTGIRFEHIDFGAINLMPNLKYIIFDRFYFCSMTPQLYVCKPNSDGVSSFQDLLSKPVLRYSTWIMATITLFGNLLVLWGRFIYRDENLAVTMVIRNLALADILMGFYLLTIGTQDFRFRNEYHKVALDWMSSWQCVAVGSLAVTSSEVSMLILAFMSLERFLLIADPFRGHMRIGLRNIFIALLAIWCMGVGIAVAPVVVWWRSSTKFYGTYSGTCFPLHIQEPYPLGWQYSAFMFLGVNLFLLLMIALLYTALLISIWRTRKATPLSLLDCEFAVRFFFIVLTDVLCWAPIIAGKIWVFFNYNISDDIYAWLVVFILPLNSAVNPLLYTFTTPKYRNQILLRGWKKITAKRRPEPSNAMMATIATGTGSSNPDDSSGRAIPLVVSH